MKRHLGVFLALIFLFCLTVRADNADPNERVVRIRWKAGATPAVIVINGVPASILRSGGGWLKLEPFEMPGNNIIQILPVDQKIQEPVEIVVESTLKNGNDAKELAKVSVDDKTEAPDQGKIEFQSTAESYVYKPLAKIESLTPEDEKSIREIVGKLLDAQREKKVDAILKLYDFSLDCQAKIFQIERKKAVEENQRMLEDLFKSLPEFETKKPESLKIVKCERGVVVYAPEQVPNNWIFNRKDWKKPDAIFPLDQLAFGKVEGKWVIVSFLEF